MNLVVDTSVIIKWFLPFPDEDYISNALAVKRKYDTGKITLHAPSILNYEIGNIFSTAVRSKKLNKSKAIEGLKRFNEYGIIFYDLREIYIDILDMSIKYGLSYYDASYITLSKFLTHDFITADRKLFTKVKNEIESVKYIADIDTN